MGNILAKIQKGSGKSLCFFYAALFLICAFLIICMSFISGWYNGIFPLVFFLSLICGVLFLAAGLHDAERDESITVEPKPLIFSTLDENGKIIKKEFYPTPPLECKEIRRTDSKVDFSIEIHSKEQAVEVLAALAVIYDKGDITDADYHYNVRKIREHFNL